MRASHFSGSESRAASSRDGDARDASNDRRCASAGADAARCLSSAGACAETAPGGALGGGTAAAFAAGRAAGSGAVEGAASLSRPALEDPATTAGAGDMGVRSSRSRVPCADSALTAGPAFAVAAFSRTALSDIPGADGACTGGACATASAARTPFDVSDRSAGALSLARRSRSADRRVSPGIASTSRGAAGGTVGPALPAVESVAIAGAPCRGCAASASVSRAAFPAMSRLAGTALSGGAAARGSDSTPSSAWYRSTTLTESTTTAATDTGNAQDAGNHRHQGRTGRAVDSERAALRMASSSRRGGASVADAR